MAQTIYMSTDENLRCKITGRRPVPFHPTSQPRWTEGLGLWGSTFDGEERAHPRSSDAAALGVGNEWELYIGFLEWQRTEEQCTVFKVQNKLEVDSNSCSILHKLPNGWTLCVSDEVSSDSWKVKGPLDFCFIFYLSHCLTIKEMFGFHSILKCFKLHKWKTSLNSIKFCFSPWAQSISNESMALKSLLLKLMTASLYQ